MRGKLERIKINLAKEERTQVKIATTPAKKIRLSYLLAAASILLLVFVGYLRHNIPSGTSPQELYTQNYDAYQLPFNTGAIDIEQALWTTAGSFYQQKEYTKAIPLLMTLLEQTKDSNAKAQLALAICHMEIAQFQEAIQIFTEMQKNKSGRYADHATWYSAMAFLGLDDLKSSKKLLNEIIQDRSNYFYKQAYEVLKKMD